MIDYLLLQMTNKNNPRKKKKNLWFEMGRVGSKWFGLGSGGLDKKIKVNFRRKFIGDFGRVLVGCHPFVGNFIYFVQNLGTNTPSTNNAELFITGFMGDRLCLKNWRRLRTSLMGLD